MWLVLWGIVYTNPRRFNGDHSGVGPEKDKHIPLPPDIPRPLSITREILEFLPEPADHTRLADWGGDLGRTNIHQDRERKYVHQLCLDRTDIMRERSTFVLCNVWSKRQPLY